MKLLGKLVMLLLAAGAVIFGPGPAAGDPARLHPGVRHRRGRTVLIPAFKAKRPAAFAAGPFLFCFGGRSAHAFSSASRRQLPL